MHTRLILPLFSLVLLFGACSSETTTSNSFRDQAKAAAAATESLSEPYFNQHHAKWSKRKFRIDDLKYDVRKTESLVSPLVGTVKFSLSSTQTELVVDRNAARASTEYSKNLDGYKVELIYALQDGRWKLTAGRYSLSDSPASSIGLTAEKIKSDPD